MLNWLRGKVSRDESTESQYESLQRGTMVVVRESAVVRPNLDSNEIQLLKDIPEFKPFLVEDVDHNSLNTINTKALVNICKRYQEHAHSCAETVANEQNQLTSRMKEIDLSVKIIMDRLTDRQRAYAKHAEHMQKVTDLTHSLKKLRYNVKETCEMMRLLNNDLPEELRLSEFDFSSADEDKEPTSAPSQRAE